MITPLFVMFRKTILTQEVTMDFYFLINCSISLYNGPFFHAQQIENNTKQCYSLTETLFFCSVTLLQKKELLHILQ